MQTDMFCFAQDVQKGGLTKKNSHFFFNGEESGVFMPNVTELRNPWNIWYKRSKVGSHDFIYEKHAKQPSKP